MAKYRVHLDVSVMDRIEVEADSEEEAMNEGAALADEKYNCPAADWYVHYVEKVEE